MPHLGRGFRSHSTQVRWGLLGTAKYLTIVTCSHSTQVRWGHLNSFSQFPPTIRFTFHTGQMGTLLCGNRNRSLGRVHIPHRSDGDCFKSARKILYIKVHIPHRSDGDFCVRALKACKNQVHIPHRSDGDSGRGKRLVYHVCSSHSTQVRWGLAPFRCNIVYKTRFTFHTGQMGTPRFYALSYEIHGFTFHTGQMGTRAFDVSQKVEYEVHIPHRSDGDCPPQPFPLHWEPGSHSTQVRWGHMEGHRKPQKILCSHSTQVRWGQALTVPCINTSPLFTFHTGQMGTSR